VHVSGRCAATGVTNRREETESANQRHAAKNFLWGGWGGFGSAGLGIPKHRLLLRRTAMTLGVVTKGKSRTSPATSCLSS
jgi:hypothetical protein